MTNSNAAMRMMILYAIIIPVAILMGYLLTNPLDYGTMGFILILLVLIASPIFIKFHHPIMVFGLAFPAQMFFLIGSPPCWQIVVILSLGIAIVERAMSREHRFLRAPAMTWALIFTAAMAVVTMQLTGGFHLHAVGGGEGGGRKYITLLLGIATFFALASRGIPPTQRKLYIALFFLSAVFGVFSDIFPYLPAPLNYINLLFPPSAYSMDINPNGGIVRFASSGAAADAGMLYILARYGLRGVLPPHLLRGALFVILFALAQIGGFRSNLVGDILILTFIFFLEGLHRTRWLPLSVLLVVIGACVVVPFTRDMPRSIQRSLSFLPLDIDPSVRVDADYSTDWRVAIWKAILPTVPEYLLLGKGYSLSSLDYQSLGPDNPFARSAQADASLESLAISNDFHSGPLSTIICFGIWGCISILAIMGAGLYILYRNYRYGDPALLAVNTLLLAMLLHHVIRFFFIFGAFDTDVGYMLRTIGFGVALNWGVCSPRTQVAAQPAQPASAPEELPQPA